MQNQQSSRQLASMACYVGAVLFTILVVLFNTIPQSIAIPIVAVAFH
jgi:hypothetical protein